MPQTAFRLAALTIVATVFAVPLLVPSALAQSSRRHKAAPAAAGTKPEPLPAAQKEYPTGAVWILKSFNDKPVPINDDITFSITKTYRGMGFSGCNMWSATIYPIRNQKFLVGPIATTRKVCDKAVTGFELAYLNAIHQGPNWDLVNSDLVMKGPTTTMRFQRSF